MAYAHNFVLKCLKSGGPADEANGNREVQQQYLGLYLRLPKQGFDEALMMTAANSTITPDGRLVNTTKTAGIKEKITALSGEDRLFLLGHGAGQIQIAHKTGDWWARALIALGLKSVKRISILACRAAGDSPEANSFARIFHAALGGHRLPGVPEYECPPADKWVKTTVTARTQTVSIDFGRVDPANAQQKEKYKADFAGVNKPGVVQYDALVGKRKTQTAGQASRWHAPESKVLYDWNGQTPTCRYVVYPESKLYDDMPTGKIADSSLDLVAWDLASDD